MLLAEVGAAFGLLGLLLVFLPLFLDAVRRAAGGTVSAKAMRLRKFRVWLIPGTIAVAAADAVAGLLTLWGTWDAARLTGVLLVAVALAVVLLAFLAVWEPR